MRLERDEYFLQMAELVARRGTCFRRQVGCVLVNHRGHVLATGYNGVAAGMPHCNEPTDQVSEDDLIMRETFVPVVQVYVPVNSESLLSQFEGELSNDFIAPTFDVYGHACSGAGSKSGEGLDSCQAIHAEQNALLQCHNVFEIHTVYVTASPCVTCTKLLMNTAAERIVFREEYPHKEARDLWVASRGSQNWVHKDHP